MGVPVEKRFRGQVRLLTLLLWRVGKSTDLDVCFQAAKDLRMIDGSHESFIRACIEAQSAIESGEPATFEVTDDIVDEVAHCVNLLNSADPA